jgi:hypothetical protein
VRCRKKKELQRSNKGKLVSTSDGVATAYALKDIEPRGELFIRPGDKVPIVPPRPAIEWNGLCALCLIVHIHLHGACAGVQGDGDWGELARL